MGRFVLVWLILAEIMTIQAMAVRPMGSEMNPQRVLLMVGTEDGVAAPPVSSDAESSSSEGGGKEPSGAQAPEIELLERHRSSEKSVAGGGVIIGGLVTIAFAAVYSYIRVTRKRDGANH